jgi:hypothetical protein
MSKGDDSDSVFALMSEEESKSSRKRKKSEKKSGKKTKVEKKPKKGPKELHVWRPGDEARVELTGLRRGEVSKQGPSACKACVCTFLCMPALGRPTAMY